MTRQIVSESKRASCGIAILIISVMGKDSSRSTTMSRAERGAIDIASKRCPASKKGETSSYSIAGLDAEYSDVLVLGVNNEEVGRQELGKSTMGKGGTLWKSIGGSWKSDEEM
ncbi:hypothetical protein P692DRAFT_20819834 [Suillus brevipes Sb2]|nr:hypothetical protein P692DRAFT_20819834 [Suillus brevipes Sb2]